MRIGIDVGGTHTDAALLDGDRVLSWTKAATTECVTGGIIAAIRTVLDQANVDATNVRCVMLGTTHFTNALVQRRNLQQVGVIRLGTPACDAIPPLSGWPEGIKNCTGEHLYLLPGGYEFDGREISQLDVSGIRKVAYDLKVKGITSVAVSCTFSTLNSEMEERVFELVRQVAPEIRVTTSHSFGRSGFLERENAAILNASLVDMASDVANSIADALKTLGIQSPFFISQNDGTLISAEHMTQFPVLTFGSGPTNSMRGAAFLTGEKNAIVMDVGGTTTDIGALVNGFPRESAVAVDIGGVRTNFRMPDVLALALGGGTRIHLDRDKYTQSALAPEEVKIGPDSTGYQLLRDSYLFGGQTLTSSDIAVAADIASFGDKTKLPRLSHSVVTTLLSAFSELLETGLDKMKTAAGQIPVILVGGGHFLVSDELKGASKVLRPQYAEVANAVGAAIAQVGAETQMIVSYEQTPRAEAIASAKREALYKVRAEGAVTDTAKVVDVDEVFMSYLPGNTARLRVKAVGELNLL